MTPIPRSLLASTPHVAPHMLASHCRAAGNATPETTYLSTRKQKYERNVCPGTSDKHLIEHKERIRSAELHEPAGRSPHEAAGPITTQRPGLVWSQLTKPLCRLHPEPGLAEVCSALADHESFASKLFTPT